MELLTLLSKPSREFTPIPFWFLNGNLTHDEIRRQLNDFNAHGVSGVVLHPRIGLAKRIRYLSKEYFSYIRTAVKEAAALNMTVFCTMRECTPPVLQTAWSRPAVPI